MARETVGYRPATDRPPTAPTGLLRRALPGVLAIVVLAATSAARGAVDFEPRLAVATDPLPWALAAVDLNRDGVADLLTGSAESANLQLHAGLGGGRFASAAGTAVGGNVQSIATGDFDEDGDLDVATASSTGSVMVLTLGSAGQVLRASSINVGDDPRAALTGDVNADGHLDLVVVNVGSRNASVILGRGAAGFGEGVFTDVGDFPVDGALADVTEDGRLDVVTVSDTTGRIAVAPGIGTGAFGRAGLLAAGRGPVAVAVADVDANGHLDLLAANQRSNQVTVQLGIGGGRFTPGRSTLTSAFPAEIVTGDWNGDGVPDVATANSLSNDVSVLEGAGHGLFRRARQFAVGEAPAGLISADLTGDGRPDLVAANGGGRTVSILASRPTAGRSSAKVAARCPRARRPVVTGTQVRCVSLVMSPAQVREQLGPPRRARVIGGGESVQWHYRGLVVRLSLRFNFVTAIRTLRPGARTAAGIVVGRRVGDLSRRLGGDACSPRGRVQTCTVSALFSSTQYRVVDGRVAWIQIMLVPDLLQ